MDTSDGKKPARPRHAASLIVLREGGGRAELLMGMRAARHRFMPNRLVFPGGGVERGDFSAAAASGLPPVTEAMLAKGAKPRLARALAAAAARELEEETGLSLGHPPALGGLSYLCRAITPPGLPIRFHARFLVVAAEAVEGRLAGSGELEGLRYYAIGESALGELPWITQCILAEVRAWLALPEPMRTAAHPTAVFRNRMRIEE